MLLHILSSRNTIINLPTGFRKSLIFELSLLCFSYERHALGSSKVLMLQNHIIASKLLACAGRLHYVHLCFIIDDCMKVEIQLS